MGCLNSHSTSENEILSFKPVDAGDTVRPSKVTKSLKEFSFSENGQSSEDPIKTIIVEVNKARTNPFAYSVFVQEQMKYVVEENGRYLFKLGTVEEKLIVGPDKFKETVEILKKTKPVKKIRYVAAMNLNLMAETKMWKDKEAQKEAFMKVNSNMPSNLILNGMFFEYGTDVLFPEICVLLCIVDDSKYKNFRRKNLLSSETQVVGVQQVISKNKGICYFTFGQEVA